MIMAGRGRRLGDIADPIKKVGPTTSPQETLVIDEPTLFKNILQINVANVNSKLLKSIAKIFTELCTSEEALKSTLSNLYNKALCDSDFTEKSVVAIETVIWNEVGKSAVRTEIFTLMQLEFEGKEIMSKSNKTRFFNAITFLLNFYLRIIPSNQRYSILAMAHLGYLEYLLSVGTEEELKFLVKQMVFNYNNLKSENSIIEQCKKFENDLRNKVINTNTTEIAKYWILLAIELSAHDFKPLSEQSKDFYVNNLKEGYTEIEACIINLKKNSKSENLPRNTRDQQKLDSTHKSSLKTKDEAELSGKLVDMVLKSPTDSSKDRRNKPSDRNHGRKSDHQKQLGNKKGFSASGHDDRFDKDENYYSVQAPRTPKLDRKKNNFSANKDDSSGLSNANSGNFITEKPA